MSAGKLIIFSAPSGSGKTSIVQRLLQIIPELEFSISASTRPKRADEVHGKDYYFMSVDEFREKISKNEFVEWEMVYEGRYYGTLKSEVERIWSHGRHVIFDVDVEGGLNLKKAYGKKALAIFVMPPSVEVLEERLRSRGTETEETLRMRLDKAIEEMNYWNKFEHVIHNHDLDIAVEEAQNLVREFLKQ